MANVTRVFGWIELGVALFGAYLCGGAVFDIVTSDPDLAPLFLGVTFPISLSFAWGGWHLVKRQDWLHQATPLFVIFAVASVFFVVEYL